MPRENALAASPHAWLAFARSDLALARQLGDPDILIEALCFHAQQAAEKSLKGVLVFGNTAFPYTHSIPTLIELVQKAGIHFPDDLRKAARLTEYASASRYPGPWDRITREEYVEALEIAEKTLRWAEEEIGENA